MYLDALLQVSDVDPFCLKELCHDVPENTDIRVGQTCAASLAALALARRHSLFLAGRSPLLIADLMSGVRQVHLRIGVRQAVGYQLQFQVLIILTVQQTSVL